MHLRKLGKTDLLISEIGLGGEWLNGLKKPTVKSILSKAIDNGINFFDFLFNELNYIKNISNVVYNYKDKIIIQTHLGTTEKDGKPKRDRNVKRNRKFFDRTLSILKTDYIDIINVQFIQEKEYDEIVGKNGLLNLANELKSQGKARYVGASTHDVMIGKKLAESELVDSIMFPLNIANHFLDGRSDFLDICKKKKLGLVAIKPFVCGKLFESNHTVYIAKYQTGGISCRKKIPKNISPIQCLNYCLSQPGVSTVIPGVRSIQEVQDILKYDKASEKQKEFSLIFNKYHKKN